VALRLTILGSGTSHGIPMIACDCLVCRSADPRDRRTRTSAVFSYDQHHVLVDTSPELRLQCLACDVRQVEAVLLTHAHADHVVGLDDLRRFTYARDARLRVFASAATLAQVRRMFGYAFTDEPDYPSAKPHLAAVEVSGPFELAGRQVTPIPYRHGPTEVVGYRIGDVAYCPDCSGIPESSRALLAGLDILVLDALRRRRHPTHFNLEQAIAEAHRIGARRTIFTHIAHELGHAATSAALPPGMELAWDGLACESE
jgi:phosphoribosyl 1,2-cyclic phosphate phosphodiesterase